LKCRFRFKGFTEWSYCPRLAGWIVKNPRERHDRSRSKFRFIRPEISGKEEA